MSKRELLWEIQKVDFALTDIILHLDMNPNNRYALQYYCYYVALYQRLVNEYERHYGALTNMTPNEHCHNWVNDPWPWEGAN